MSSIDTAYIAFLFSVSAGRLDWPLLPLRAAMAPGPSFEVLLTSRFCDTATPGAVLMPIVVFDIDRSFPHEPIWRDRQ